MNENEHKELELSVRRQEYIKVLNKTRIWTHEDHQKELRQRIRKRIQTMVQTRSQK